MAEKVIADESKIVKSELPSLTICLVKLRIWKIMKELRGFLQEIGFRNVTLEDYENHFNGDLVDFYSSICDQTFENVSEFYDCQESITYEKDEILLGKDSCIMHMEMR